MLEKAFAVGAGGIVGQNVRLALSGLPIEVYDVVAGLGGRPITKPSLHRLFAADGPRSAAAAPSSTSTASSSSASCAATREVERPGPARREHAARPRHRRREVALKGADGQPADQVLPSGVVRGGQPPARSRAAHRAGRHRALELPDLRPPRLPGLRRGARRALRARRRAARRPTGKLIATNATGCLEVFSTPYPESSWQLPWIHSLFGNAPAVATGVAAALKAKGRDRHPRDRARAATAARSTSASPACRACSSATTTCSSSATTTRRT